MIPRRNITVLTLFCVGLACTAPLFLDAQNSKPQNSQEAKLSPKYWELWRAGFEAYEAGESALLAGRNEEAADFYRKAVKSFQKVKENNPSWNKNVIDYRLSLAGRRLKTALRRMEYRSADQTTDPDMLIREAAKSPDAQLSTLRDSLAESERQNAELRKAAEQGKLARDQVSDLLAEKKEIDTKYAMLLLQYNELKKKADNAVEGSSAVENSLRKEQLRSDALVKVVSDLRAENGKLQDMIRDFRANLDDAKKNLSHAEKTIALSKKTEELLSDMQAKYISMEKSSAEQNAKLTAELKDLRGKLDAKSAECDALRNSGPDSVKKISAEADALRKQIDDFKTANETLRMDIQTQEAKIIAASGKAQRQDSMIASLNSANKDITAENSKLKSELQKLKDAADSSRTFAETVQKNNENLQAELKLLAERVNKLPVNTASDDVDKIKNELERKQLSEKITALQAELVSARKDLTRTKELIAANTDKDAQLEKLQNALKSAQAELDTLKKTPPKTVTENAAPSANDEMQKKLQAVQTDMAAAEAKNKELAAANEALTESVKKASEEKEKFTDRNEKLAKDLLNTQALLEKARLEAQDDSKIRAAEKERDLWKDKFEQGEASRKNLEKNLVGHETENQALQTKIAQVETDRDTVLKKSVNLEAQLENWKKGSNTVPKETLAVKEAAIDSLMKDLKKQGDEFNKLKTKLMETEAENARFRKNIQLARSVTEDAMAESRKLRAELTLLRRANPDVAIAAVKPAQGMPQEIKVLTDEENSASKRASSADMSKYESLMKAAKDAEEKKNFDDALWQYWAAADAGVTQPDPYLAISRIHAARNNPEQGIKTYERALRLGAKRVPEIEDSLKKQLIEKQKEIK